MSDNSRNIENTRICPLCQSDVRLFFVHFNEKILMCENVECEFPFGHEELQFVREDYDVQTDFEVASVKSKLSEISSFPNASFLSTTAWSDVDKMNRLLDADELEMKSYSSNQEKCEAEKEKINKMEILKNVESIKKLNEELLKEDTDTKKKCLKNEKWIKYLKSKQDISGCKLLRPEEISILKEKQSTLYGELKLDIEPGSSSSISSIRIDFVEESNESSKELSGSDNLVRVEIENPNNIISNNANDDIHSNNINHNEINDGNTKKHEKTITIMIKDKEIELSNPIETPDKNNTVEIIKAANDNVQIYEKSTTVNVDAEKE